MDDVLIIEKDGIDGRAKQSREAFDAVWGRLKWRIVGPAANNLPGDLRTVEEVAAETRVADLESPIGEAGPELHTPDTSGQIVPAGNDKPKQTRNSRKPTTKSNKED